MNFLFAVTIKNKEKKNHFGDSFLFSHIVVIIENMIEILIRFLIIYFFLLFSMKLLGKRQIGEMQMSELVAAFFLSELATFAVTNTKHSIFHSIIPIAVMILIEFGISFLAVKNPLMKKVFDFSPSILIRDGQVLQKELFKNRLTLDELFSMLRICGYYDLQKVRFAILEPNGQLSVVPYAKHDAASCDDLNVSTQENGFSVAIIDDGKINRKAMEAIGKNEKWLRRILNQSKICDEKEVFLLVSDFLGNWKIFEKDNFKSEKN
ncbi:MAG: DUF421 domain-containing protein [Clostridia bacterium]|nr:DUF421 domain-containing protein [Clostridia bacterium]